MKWIKLGDPGYHQIKAILKGEIYDGPTSEADQKAVQALFPEGSDEDPQKEPKGRRAARRHQALN